MSRQTVKIRSENVKGEIPAVIFGEIKGKGLVVIQEWWGLNEQIQDEAGDIAKDGGFVTIVPDLYRGKIATDNEEAGHLMSNLDWQGAVLDIKACVNYLKGKGCTKVGVTGFCMGGALSLATAALGREGGVDAAAPFYGIPSAELCDVSKIKVPLQCHFGEKDSVAGFSSPKEQQLLQDKLRSGGVNFEFYSYDADHAFTHKGGANYSEECTKLAFGRMYEFMNKHLA